MLYASLWFTLTLKISIILDIRHCRLFTDFLWVNQSLVHPYHITNIIPISFRCLGGTLLSLLFMSCTFNSDINIHSSFSSSVSFSVFTLPFSSFMDAFRALKLDFPVRNWHLTNHCKRNSSNKFWRFITLFSTAPRINWYVLLRFILQRLMFTKKTHKVDFKNTLEIFNNYCFFFLFFQLWAFMNR